MIKQLTHAVKDFKFFFANLCPPDLDDHQKIALIKAHYQAYHLSSKELAELATLVRNPDTFFAGDFGPNLREFVSSEFYIKTPLYSAGLLRVKESPSGSYIEQILSGYGGLFNIQWQEEYGIAPLTEELFICRTVQPVLNGSAVHPLPGVSPLTVMLIPTKLVWDLIGKTAVAPCLFGGYSFKCQAKQTEVPPEVLSTVPEVKYAFQLSAYRNPSKNDAW